MSAGLKPGARSALGEETLKWSTLAANQGDKRGEAVLARIYLEGKLVKQDLIEAFKWGDLSAKNPSFESALWSGASMRDQAILKMTAEQMAEAHKRVEAFVPHQVKKSDLPDPAWVAKIELGGISGATDHRLAIINNKTLGKNEELAMKIEGKQVTVRCLEIRESSVVISIEGIEGTRELNLHH